MRTPQKPSSFVLASFEPSTYKIWEESLSWQAGDRVGKNTAGSPARRRPQAWRSLFCAPWTCGLAGSAFSTFSVKWIGPCGFCLLILLGSIVAVTAAEEEDPSVTPALAHRAEALILARCSVCHTPDLIHQQRLPAERWTDTVDKMRQWGAELSPDEAALLIRYLSARYHPGAPDRIEPIENDVVKEESAVGEASDAPVAGVAARGAGIFSMNCQACHGAGAAGGVGPKLAGNPILKNEGAFWETVLHGRGAMPAWGGALSEQDIADIHAWLLKESPGF
jgi:cytochrome c oxidase cbb3-type subunit 3